MNVIKAGYEILTPISEGGIEELQRIERAARVCYKSEDRITPDGESAKKMVAMLIKNGHEAMIEHSIVLCRFFLHVTEVCRTKLSDTDWQVSVRRVQDMSTMLMISLEIKSALLISQTVCQTIRR